MTNPKDFILGDRKDDVCEGVIAETSDATVVDLITNDVLITGFLDLHEIDHAVVQSHQQLLGSLVEIDAERLLRVPLRP